MEQSLNPLQISANHVESQPNARAGVGAKVGQNVLLIILFGENRIRVRVSRAPVTFGGFLPSATSRRSNFKRRCSSDSNSYDRSGDHNSLIASGGGPEKVPTPAEICVTPTHFRQIFKVVVPTKRSCQDLSCQLFGLSLARFTLTDRCCPVYT